MNSIVLKSEHGEYYPGEEVTGSVYLNIVRPTAGRGVKVNIYISEEFKYSYVGKDGYLETEEKKIVYLKDENVIYEDESPFCLGSYVFPIKFTIPPNAAGSFCFIKSQTPAWKGESHCVVTATVIDSASLMVSQTIVILNCTKMEFDERHIVAPQSVVYHLNSLLIWKKNKGISVTCKLLKNIYRTGDSLQLRLIVANNTKLNIQAFKIKLLRNLVFKSEKEEKERENKMCDMDCMCMKHPIQIQPEDGPHVVWEKTGLLTGDISLMNNVLDNLLIPLKNNDGMPIIPSICGQCLECKYGLEILLHLTNGSSITINYHIPCILPSVNTYWDEMVLPEWIHSATVMPS